MEWLNFTKEENDIVIGYSRYFSSNSVNMFIMFGVGYNVCYIFNFHNLLFICFYLYKYTLCFLCKYWYFTTERDLYNIREMVEE